MLLGLVQPTPAPRVFGTINVSSSRRYRALVGRGLDKLARPYRGPVMRHFVNRLSGETDPEHFRV
jgi:hypothetical protein